MLTVEIFKHKALMALPIGLLEKADRVTCCGLTVKDRYNLMDVTYGEHLTNPRVM